MRLANGIVIDKEATFGALKFSALRREVHLQNEDGSVSEEIKERTYDLKSRGQGRMIQVSIPASVPLKEFDYNAEVELINPVADTVATATFQGAEVDWYIKAEDTHHVHTDGVVRGVGVCSYALGEPPSPFVH